jgi:hypothetical protein
VAGGQEHAELLGGAAGVPTWFTCRCGMGAAGLVCCPFRARFGAGRRELRASGTVVRAVFGRTPHPDVRALVVPKLILPETIMVLVL